MDTGRLSANIERKTQPKRLARKNTSKRRNMPLPSWRDWKNVVNEVKRPQEVIVEEPTLLDILNEANENDLAKIKGVGPKRLKQIVCLRPFTDETHLKKELPLIAKKLLEWADSD